MPTKSSFGPESCRGSLLKSIPVGEFGQWAQMSCLSVRSNRLTTGEANRPIGYRSLRHADGCRRVTRAGRWLYWWESHPTEVQAQADELGVEVAELFCAGCQNLLSRLEREGRWIP